jgi:RimJ/RimL family protein N-acetyltransferase
METILARPYQSDDYKIIAPWFIALNKFYDGHTNGEKLIDQLIGKENGDENGFFTVKKELWVFELGKVVVGFYCLNFKRGGSVKLGPMIVGPEFRGAGVGKAMMEDLLERVQNERKVYATTNENNLAINNLLDRHAFQREGIYPDHYKRGQNEIIWGLVIQQDIPLYSSQSLCVTTTSTKKVKVRDFIESKDRAYLNEVSQKLLEWHDDLGDDFVQAIINAWQRGRASNVNFQDKSKWILIAESEKGYEGLAIVSPKRGGPVKLYPLIGTREGQRSLIAEVIMRSQKIGSHKLYGFCSYNDQPQRETFKLYGFKERGLLIQPYKPGTQMVTVDLHFYPVEYHSIRIYGTYLDMIIDGRKI